MKLRLDHNLSPRPVPRILIVDDDPVIAKILRKALTGIGEVHSVASGGAALRMVAELPIDLVLLDIVMPDMDGFATCRALLQYQPDISVIFLTCVRDTASEILAFEVGGRDFITKPINLQAVRARVTTYLRVKAQQAEVLAANAALRESEELARRQLKEIKAVYACAPAGLCVLDRDLRVVRINERLARINGPSAADHLGRTLREMIPALAATIEPLLKHVIASGEPLRDYEATSEFPAQPGRPRTWIGNFHPLQDDAGQVIGVNVVTVDITERKLAEQTLRESEQRLQGLTADLAAEIAQRRVVEERLRRSEQMTRGQLAEIQAYYDTAPVGLFILDTQLRYQRINQRLAESNGQPVAAHLGRTVRDVLPDLADAVEPLFQRVITTGEPLLGLEIVEHTATRPGGHRVWQADYHPLRNAAGEIIGVNGFAEDITERQQIAQNLRDSERRFRELFEHLPIAYQALDHRGCWLDANQAMADLLGFSDPSGLLGRDFADYCEGATRDQFAASFAAFKATGTTCGELRLRRRDGSSLTVIHTGRIQHDASGQFMHAHCVMTDISGRRAMEEEIRELNASLEQKVDRRTAEVRASNAALRASEERFRKLFEETCQAVFLVADGRCIAANRAALAMLRLDRLEQLQGRSPFTFSPPLQPDGEASAEKAAALVRMAFQQGSNRFEWTHLRADDEPFTADVSLTLIRQGEQELLHVVLTDISDKKVAQARIEYLAFHDPLTGLGNRVLGQERLLQAVSTASRDGSGVAVLCLDVNQFKYVNDTHGQVVGDLLLKDVALRLARHLRRDDSLCRLSADEFMMVLQRLPPDHAVGCVAERCDDLLAKLATPFDLEGRQLFASFAIGVAVYPRDGRDAETLMRHADTALGAAKQAGHHNYRFFAPQMNADLTHFVATRDALRSALEREEFVLHYQPQLDLHSHRVVGVEALIRWQRPDVGLTAPGAFIAAAEESGLIVPIGRWVLREACRQRAAWRDLGWHDFVVAVNLSAVQFRHGHLEQDVMAALEDSGLDPTHLELELTESILLDNMEAVIAAIARWQERGIALSIDDFGTGYSSLAYLKRLKVDKLKIDRSFITNLQGEGHDGVIVEAIIQIARSMNLKTIAEGVESIPLANQLRFIGCDQVQGYLYSKPLPANELEQWLRQRHGLGG